MEVQSKQNPSQEVKIQELTIQKQSKLQKQNQYIQFQFPSNEFKDIKFQSVDSIMQHLLNQRQTSNEIFRVKHTKNDYVYLMCRKCKIKISFKRYQNFYIVTSFHNQHHHRLKNEKQTQQRQITNFIKQNCLQIDSFETTKILMDTFKLSQKRITYIKSKLDVKIQNIANLLLKLQMNKYKVVTFDWNTNQPLPNILAISSYQMQQECKLYSDCLHFQMVSGISGITSPDGVAKWNLGIFSGIRQDLSPSIFGLVFIRDQKSYNFANAIKIFIKMMSIAPKTIITQPRKSLILAMKRINQQNGYQINHILDHFTILQKIQNELPKSDRKKYFPLFKKLVYSKNLCQIKKSLKQIEQMQNQQIQQYIQTQFNPFYKLFCYYFSAKAFRGLSLKRFRLKNFIKIGFYPQKNIQKIIIKLDKLVQTLLPKSLKNQDIALIKVFNDSELQKVRQCIQKRVFQFFFQNYVNSFNMKVIKKSCSQKGRFFNYNGNDIIQKIINQQWTQERQILNPGLNNCYCGDLQKIGLPCSHLIAIRRQLKLPYQDLISNRWKIKIQKKQKKRILHKISARKEKNYSLLQDDK